MSYDKNQYSMCLAAEGIQQLKFAFILFKNVNEWVNYCEK